MNPTLTESLPIISLVAVGFILKKVNVLKEEDGSLLSRLIMNVTLPCVIFLSISQARIEPFELLLLAASGFFIAMVLRIIGGSVAGLLKLEDSIAGVVILGCMVMNIGSLMYPVVSTVFGAEAVSHTAAFDIGNSAMASGYGYYIATRFGSKKSSSVFSSIKKVFTIPVVWAIILALIVNLTGFTTPSFITKMLTPVSAANAPLALFALGIFVNFKFPQWKLMGLTVFLRMGVGFLLGQLVVLVTHMQGLDRTVVTLGSAMPIGMIPMVYASTEGMDTEFAAACISLSIIIGVVVTPLLLTIYPVS
jgi:malate permease and related proteins